MKDKKIPLIIALLCIGQYASQGISGLSGQCIYYLTREYWKLSATMLGLISWIVGLAWYCKIIFGYFVDNVTIKGKRTTYYLKGSYIGLLLMYLYIILFGFNLMSLIITGILINICIAFADVTVDREMVITEQKQNLKGRLQALQWSSLGIAGLIVSLLGAWIAKHFPEHVNYKVAYGIAGIIPMGMLIYLSKNFKEKTIKKIKRSSILKTFKTNFKKVINRRLLLGLAFIACLQFCPSFGTALMIKVREVLHVDKMFLGYLGAMGTVLGVIGYMLYYKWAYKFSMKKLLYFMVIFSTITNLFYLYLPNKWFLVAYNLAFGAFGGITFMTLLAFFVKIIPTGSEAFFYALVTSVSNFCARGGNFFGGVIYDHFGYNTNVIISSGATLLCLAFIPFLRIKNDN
jgi:MFS family permease